MNGLFKKFPKRGSSTISEDDDGLIVGWTQQQVEEKEPHSQSSLINRFYSNFSNTVEGSDIDTDDVGKLRRRCVEAEALADALKVELNDLKQQHAHVIEKNKDYEGKC